MKKSASTGNLFASIPFLPSAMMSPRRCADTATSAVVPQQDDAAARNKKKRARRRSSNRSRSSLEDLAAPDLVVDMQGKSETELMAEIFKTANELEDLAKKARKARRRKTTGGVRRKSKCSTTADESDERSVSSGGFSLTGLFLSPRGNGGGGACGGGSPSSRGSGGLGRSSRRSRSLNSSLRRGSQRLQQPPKLVQDLDDREGLTMTKLPLEDLSSKFDHFKPSYYHDSDDSDDDLILDPDENLDDYSRHVEKEVMNMSIVVNWNTACTARSVSPPPSP